MAWHMFIRNAHRACAHVFHMISLVTLLNAALFLCVRCLPRRLIMSEWLTWRLWVNPELRRLCAMFAPHCGPLATPIG